MNQLGDTLAHLLEERGIAQTELGRRLDITGSAVNLWVRGRARPSRHNLERIEHELRLPAGTLLALAGYRTDDNDNTPTVEALIRADPGLAPEDKRVLLRVLLLARERHGRQDDRAEHERLAELNRTRRRTAANR